jgi:hypothetical protein
MHRFFITFLLLASLLGAGMGALETKSNSDAPLTASTTPALRSLSTAYESGSLWGRGDD